QIGAFDRKIRDLYIQPSGIKFRPPPPSFAARNIKGSIMSERYWSSITNARVGRRRVLGGIGAGAAGAAFLAACGGGSKSSSSSSSTDNQASSLITKVQDETASLVKGGIYKSILGTPPSLDPHFTGPQTTHCWMCYSQLLKTKPGHLQNTNGDVEPELFESWEI